MVNGGWFVEIKYFSITHLICIRGGQHRLHGGERDHGHRKGDRGLGGIADFTDYEKRTPDFQLRVFGITTASTS